MEKPATAIARQLAERAEDVCRRYLSKGRREGRYWLIGDVQNTPGRSLYVRLADTERGRAGKWTDAQNGDHGDMLDIIAAAIGARSMRETLEEARAFLSLPPPEPTHTGPSPRIRKAPTGTPEAARRLFDSCRPISGTVVEAYLRKRAITVLRGCAALRFHPRCWYRLSEEDAPETRNAWPAMIAAVTDFDGRVTGVHRTWLDGETLDKAQVAYSRRSMGHILGHGVRFGSAGSVMTFGEGLETMLSLRCGMPRLPAIAGTSSAHLAAILFPPTLTRLYVARDDDPAGAHAVATLCERAHAADIELISLEPDQDDFNADLRRLGLERLRENLKRQLMAEDRARFL
ncbi:DUF7146 domain-containing protein [Sphingomonas sp. TX0522]|uniref:DUF7146 domain-containing protein n=1 Tax=Sphingomonas sp. TX0522 TaxID=2479205 RepID=UPI0018DF5366|nr:toprim domain-containing protein [Sphingomonas sp. TX0522]MBI0530308.1 DNA primase [Sphingomonas sp. TX0522]